jgi:hypothetical protein
VLKTVRWYALNVGIAIASTELLAAAYVWRYDGFGQGDLIPFLFWISPFGVLLSFIVTPGAAWTARRRLHLFIGMAIAAVVGAAVGFAWALFMAWSMGPWFGTFSFPVLTILVSGGAITSVLGFAFRRRLR